MGSFEKLRRFLFVVFDVRRARECGGVVALLARSGGQTKPCGAMRERETNLTIMTKYCVK